MFPVLPATVAWFLMLIAAIINGAIRDKYLNAHFGPQMGHIISTMVLGIIILLISYGFVWLYGQGYTGGGMIALGGYWLVLVVGFEFIFGHYVAGHSWGRLLADYNLLQGRIWVLVLLTTFLAPWLCQKLITK